MYVKIVLIVVRRVDRDIMVSYISILHRCHLLERYRQEAVKKHLGFEVSKDFHLLVRMLFFSLLVPTAASHGLDWTDKSWAID